MDEKVNDGDKHVEESNQQPGDTVYVNTSPINKKEIKEKIREEKKRKTPALTIDGLLLMILSAVIGASEWIYVSFKRSLLLIPAILFGIGAILFVCGYIADKKNKKNDKNINELVSKPSKNHTEIVGLLIGIPLCVIGNVLSMIEGYCAGGTFCTNRPGILSIIAGGIVGTGIWMIFLGLTKSPTNSKRVYIIPIVAVLYFIIRWMIVESLRSGS